jgi:hypothetical protein
MHLVQLPLLSGELDLEMARLPLQFVQAKWPGAPGGE